jgi:hypothetical protein
VLTRERLRMTACACTRGDTRGGGDLIDFTQVLEPGRPNTPLGVRGLTSLCYYMVEVLSQHTHTHGRQLSRSLNRQIIWRLA